MGYGHMHAMQHYTASSTAGTSDTAKIELWDVVDKGTYNVLLLCYYCAAVNRSGKLKKGKGVSLKLFNLPSKSAQVKIFLVIFFHLQSASSFDLCFLNLK